MDDVLLTRVPTVIGPRGLGTAPRDLRQPVWECRRCHRAPAGPSGPTRRRRWLAAQFSALQCGRADEVGSFPHRGSAQDAQGLWDVVVGVPDRRRSWDLGARRSRRSPAVRMTLGQPERPRQTKSRLPRCPRVQAVPMKAAGGDAKGCAAPTSQEESKATETSCRAGRDRAARK